MGVCVLGSWPVLQGWERHAGAHYWSVHYRFFPPSSHRSPKFPHPQSPEVSAGSFLTWPFFPSNGGSLSSGFCGCLLLFCLPAGPSLQYPRVPPRLQIPIVFSLPTS